MPAFAEPLAIAETPAPRHPLKLYREVAAERGLDLTSLRLDVLGSLWREHAPMGTYGIAEGLNRSGLRRAHANSVHRTLQTLIETGLVVPIVSWKRFLISPDPRFADWLINLCDRCSSFACVPAGPLAEQLRTVSKQRDFVMRSLHLECIGRCPRCN